MTSHLFSNVEIPAKYLILNQICVFYSDVTAISEFCVVFVMGRLIYVQTFAFPDHPA